MRFSLSFVLFIAVTLSGCSTSTKSISMKPEDAKIPELHFDYWKDGKWRKAEGHAGDEFTVGNVKKFRVRTHKGMGNCLVNYLDGDSHIVKDCSNKGEVLFDTEDFEDYYEGHPTVLAFSVAGEKTGIQTGYFYPFVGIKRESLPVLVRCPHVQTSRNITTCSRPATFTFRMVAKNPLAEPGDLQYQYSCRDGQSGKEVFTDVESYGSEVLELKVNEASYCAIAFAFRNKDKTKKLSHLLHVRFYDPKYIPLPLPNVSETSKGYKVCGAEEYRLTSVNGDDRGRLKAGNCINVKGNSLDMLSWDDIGRLNHVHKSKLPSNMEDIGRNFFTPRAMYIDNAGWEFYKEARPWVESEIRKLCTPITASCAREKYKEVLYHPRMVKAVEEWDAKYLYEK